jgi:TatD DNase family protein
MAVLVDSHCHLDDNRFDADREAVIARALAAGVHRMLAIGTGSGPPDLEAGLRLAAAHEPVYATIGVHPHDASKASEETLIQLRALAGRPKLLAIGEIGLDYHYNFSPPEVQREVFACQLRLAREIRKPVIIHTREAWQDTLDLLREHCDPALGGIMHCFSGGPGEADEALALGFYLGFGGVLTFPKAQAVQEAARSAPAGRILVETDAPYLAPAPHRGKRNEPAFVADTARRLAELRGVTFEEIASCTTANFDRLFAVAQST